MFKVSPIVQRKTSNIKRPTSNVKRPTSNVKRHFNDSILALMIAPFLASIGIIRSSRLIARSIS